MRKDPRYLLLAAIFLLSSLNSTATVRLPSIISSNMVLQQGSTAKLWGWCDAHEKIYVFTSWNNRTDSVTGTRDANWQIGIPTPAAGGPYTITIKGSNTILLENVMIGEVWVCSGQSNMEMCETWGLPDVRAELPECNTNNIHFFHVPRTTSIYPQEDCHAQWTPCDSVALKSFSAVAYFFGKELNRKLNVPIGLIESSWGGTPAEVWTPAALIEGDTILKWAAAALHPSTGWPYLPGYCYNGMIAPLTNYPVAGAIWYQGEGNTSGPATYGRLLQTMIGAWRQAWNKELPFYYVQIAPYTYGAKNVAGVLREQQASCMSMDKTGMVVVSDITGDTTNIHPKNKHDVGLRLANWALGDTYHLSGINYKGPQYKSMDVKADKVVLTLDNVPTALEIKGRDVRELSIAGDNRVFYPAQARVEGNKLIVSSAQVRHPMAVRYQFDNAGIGNIFSKEGLPVAPFRTDHWNVDL
ncbi:MAG: sialate O-acetylesterase [Bacteroidota bacterium]|nr:sialate O-acetylesterase [Bacteroidota bacterium]MDP4214757.1 sialate O-acetylesterase [Bacteroidota bacterium]MDP4245675.1 sialate O-acetylesterase [Bacteroidota bacterium]